MLEPRHIVKLRVDSVRVQEHMGMPAPAYVTKPLIAQFSALSDAILTELLGIPTSQFQAQLGDARKRGTEYICDGAGNKPMGLSVSTSLVKSGDIMKKHLVVPCDFLRFDRRLSDNIMIGAFIQGKTDGGNLTYDPETVTVAGWVTATDIKMLQTSAQPPMFQSKLNVVMVPCTALRPIDTLMQTLAPGQAIV